jgi:class 3 adenylate cyclase
MRRARQGTILVTLLFTDIVGSTVLAERLGDRRWRELLARHHRLVREQLKSFGGRELDTAGDGFFASFARPADGIRCACAISDGVRGLGIEIRAGLHIGEVEQLGAKPSGVAVHVAARTMSSGGPGEVRVTGLLKDLVPGSGFGFDDLGSHSLKGIPGEWHLFRVSALDGVPRPLPLDLGEAETRLSQVQAPIFPRRGRAPAAILAIGALAAVLVTIIVLARARPPQTLPPKSVTPSPRAPLGGLVVIDASTRMLRETIPLGFSPGPVVFAEGSVWIVDESGDLVHRLDAVTHKEEARIEVDHDPVDIAVGAGSVWVANHFGRSVSRIDPGVNTAETIDLDLPPLHIAASTEGVWVDDDASFTPSGPRADLATIEPSTNRVVDSKAINAPCGPVLGGGANDGWAATAFGQLWHLDPTSGVSDEPRFVFHKGAAGVLVDLAENLIWIGQDGPPGNLFSLDLCAGVLSVPIPIGSTADRYGPGCIPIWIALGGSYVWVTNSDDHTLTVIAKVSRQSVDTIQLAGKPTGLAAGVGQIWAPISLP